MKKYSYLIVIVLISSLVLTGCTLLSNVGQVPTTGQSGISYLVKNGVVPEPPVGTIPVDLFAGQTLDVGDVLVWNDANTLYVKFVYTGSECGFLEVHLQVDKDAFSSDILTKKGNPIPGKFEKSNNVGCFTEHTFTYDLEEEGFGCGDPLVIAAHAVVPSGEVNADNLDGPVYATNVFSVTPGTNAVREPSYTLGAPDSEYNKVDTFYSLGINGCIELELEDFVGGTLTVYETTWQHSYNNYARYPEESADISVSADGVNWTYLGKADNSGQSSSNVPVPNEFDLEECIKYIRICDTTNPDLHTGAYNAFDLDAIEAEYYCEKETAWGDGNRFVEKGSWATFFTYVLHMPLWNSTGEAGVGYTCAGGALKTVDGPYGFVILNTDASGGLIVEFVLKNATPSANFQLYINQVKIEEFTCTIKTPNMVDELTTDSQGDGNAHFYLPRWVDADKFWVSAMELPMPYYPIHGLMLRCEAVVLD